MDCIEIGTQQIWVGFLMGAFLGFLAVTFIYSLGREAFNEEENFQEGPK